MSLLLKVVGPTLFFGSLSFCLAASIGLLPGQFFFALLFKLMLMPLMFKVTGPALFFSSFKIYEQHFWVFR
jgi:hypothetical protein